MAKKKNTKITKNIISNFILWTLIIIISISMLNYFDLSKKSQSIPYSTFISLLNDEQLNINISKATISGNDLSGNNINDISNYTISDSNL